MKALNQGQSLVSVLVSLALIGMGTISFLSQFKFQSKATRNITALGGVNDLSHSLDLLFSSPQCASTGSYFFAGATAGVVVSRSGYSLDLDTIKFSNRSIAVTSLASTTLFQSLQPYSVASIQLSALGGNSATQFPFTLQVSFATSVAGPPPLPVTKSIMVYTDSLSKVVGACFAGSGTGSTGGGGGSQGPALNCQSYYFFSYPTPVKPVSCPKANQFPTSCSTYAAPAGFPICGTHILPATGGSPSYCVGNRCQATALAFSNSTRWATELVCCEKTN